MCQCPSPNLCPPHVVAAAKLLQSCPTLCDPIDSSPPGSPVPGILQARTLEWVAVSFSHAWKWKVKVKSLSHVRHLATPWTAAHQAPPSMRFSRKEYWSGVPLPSPMPPHKTAQTEALLYPLNSISPCPKPPKPEKPPSYFLSLWIWLLQTPHLSGNNLWLISFAWRHKVNPH